MIHMMPHGYWILGWWSPFANTLRLNPRLAPVELLSVSQRHEANFAWHLWHVNAWPKVPSTAWIWWILGVGFWDWPRAAMAAKHQDAPSSLSIVERQCVEWSLSTSTMPSTTPRGKRPNDQKGHVHHLIKHFKPTKNNQGVTYSWLRPWHTMYNTSLLSNCVKLQQSWQGSGSIPQKLQKHWEVWCLFFKGWADGLPRFPGRLESPTLAKHQSYAIISINLK